MATTVLPHLPAKTRKKSSSSKRDNIVAVVTGGGTGFGREQALALCRSSDDDDSGGDGGARNVSLILVGRREEPLHRVRSELLRAAPSGCRSCRCEIVAGDVGKIETWERIAKLLDEEFDGRLHFLGDNAANPDPGRPWHESEDPCRDIVQYNTVDISSVELSYHFLIPYLIRGAAADSDNNNSPSVVMDMSSCASVDPRSLCHQLPTCTPAKCAIDAITRCSHGLSKDRNIRPGLQRKPCCA